MAAFAYSAINAQGLVLTGEIHAPDPAAAREQLRIRGLLAKKLDELPASDLALRAANFSAKVFVPSATLADSSGFPTPR